MDIWANYENYRNVFSYYIDALAKSVMGHPFWEEYLLPITLRKRIPFSIHLAILVEPYLKFILDGKKTVESRFSINKIAPYEKIYKGDIILLKRSGGPIIGICKVTNSQFYRVDSKSLSEIKHNFSNALCVHNTSFWKEKESSLYATIICIDKVIAIDPISFVKRDRRGWIVLHKKNENNSMVFNE
jgi:hypothetical protein